MKKIISLLLCVVVCCLILVSCADDTIGADLDGYKEKNPPKVTEALVFDFYIIVGEGTTAYAQSTVERMINSYLSDKFNTTLRMNFVKESEYVSTAVGATSAKGDNRADIILVAGHDMFETLYAKKALVNLNSFFASDSYGLLGTNLMINSNILAASTVKETIGADEVDVKYVVPNNHVVGSYDYVMINDKVAENYGYEFAINPDKDVRLKGVDLTDADLVKIEGLKQAIIADGDDPAKYIISVNDASYSARYEYVENGYVCGVLAKPTVDAEEAHKSSFAIVKQDGDDGSEKYTEYYRRCMEVIYALNSDIYLRNLLQYGVLNTNYSQDDSGVVTPITEGSSTYNMNLLYTGPVFNAYYCDTNGWTAKEANAAKAQNGDSTILPVSES